MEEMQTGVLQEEGIIVKIVATPKLYKTLMNGYTQRQTPE